MGKKLPSFDTDEEAIAFLEREDLSDYIDAKKLVRVRVNFDQPRFEELPKTQNVHIRVSKPLLDEVKKKASLQGINYQKYIRRVLEASLQIDQDIR